MKDYSLFLCCFFLPLGCIAQSNFITGQTYDCFYTDIEDSTISQSATFNGSSNYYELNLDGHSYWDVRFECHYFDSPDTTKMTGITDARSYIDFAVSGSSNLTPFPEGVSIPDDLTIYNSTWEVDWIYPSIAYFSSDHPESCTCAWDTSGIAYMVFRARSFSDSDESVDTTYGWIRLKSTVTSGDPTITIYDWAVKDVISGGYEIKNEKIQIYPNPAFEKIKIIGLTNEKTFKVTDLSGRILKSGTILQHPLEITISEFPSGLYLIVVDEKTINMFMRSK